MKPLKETKSKHYIQHLIEEGEHEQQDFKFKISDARKIARSISAFANCSGGRLLIGVKDNGKVAGVESDEEMYMIEQAATLYCRPEQTVKFSSYRVEGKSVLKVDVASASKLPVVAQDDDRNWRAYYRVADENIVAHPLHVRIWQSMQCERPVMIAFTKNENVLMDYLGEHEYITLEEYMKIAHISKRVAEESLVKLCVMRALDILYKNGQCMFVLGGLSDDF